MGWFESTEAAPALYVKPEIRDYGELGGALELLDDGLWPALLVLTAEPEPVAEGDRRGS